MTRAEFSREFNRAMRFVLQKIERENETRLKTHGVRTLGLAPDDRPVLDANDALNEAENNTDAAIDQLADHLFDALAGGINV